MKFENVYFFNGTAYAGKSTVVKGLAKKHNGITCEENYHNALLPQLDRKEFPNLTYTRDLEDWHHFIRRTPDEYEDWIRGSSRECEILELSILENLVKENGDRPIFVDTNISVETLQQISDVNHVLIMLADPEISVSRFFDRPDREKQFLYRLILEEADPALALENFKECLKRINTPEQYEAFLRSGFHVILRDENRSIEETLTLAGQLLGLNQ